MKNSFGKKLASLATVYLASAILLLPPLYGVYAFGRRKQLVLAAGCFALFILFRKVLYSLENRLGCRSLQNPQSKIYGSGFTFVAPWVKRKKRG